MITKLRLIGQPTADAQLQPGDCWNASPSPGGGWLRYSDSTRTEGAWDIAAEHGARQPMYVVLPNGVVFRLLGPTINRIPHEPFVEAGRGWRVAGELPNVTVAPSIFYDPGGAKEWHGWLQGGELRPC